MLISAVVVTFNRCRDLLRCLDSLQAQLIKPDTVIIINNASTDDTLLSLIQLGFKYSASKSEKLDQQVYLWSSSQIEFILVSLGSNQGGAGGFYVGQKLAYETGHDLIWMMDDDGYPDKMCLENLLAVLKKQSDLAIINPLVLNQDNQLELAFGLPGNIKTVEQAVAHCEHDTIDNVANPFNGTLIPKGVIEKIGFVKHEMFIWGDEIEYIERARKLSIQLLTVCNALFYHPESKTKMTKKIFGFLYIHEKPNALEMNYYRNAGYLHRNYFKSAIPKYLMRHALYFVLSLQLIKFVLFIKYYIDGYTNRFRLPCIRK